MNTESDFNPVFRRPSNAENHPPIKELPKVPSGTTPSNQKTVLGKARPSYDAAHRAKRAHTNTPDGVNYFVSIAVAEASERLQSASPRIITRNKIPNSRYRNSMEYVTFPPPEQIKKDAEQAKAKTPEKQQNDHKQKE